MSGTLFPALSLFFLALLPRLAALGRYVTPDELIWVYRSVRFREALLSADWANTIQSGHPGVITTWLGALAIQLQLWLQPASRADLAWIQKLYWLSPDNGEAMKTLATFLTASRLSVILVTSLGIVAIYHLASRWLGRTPALIGALLLALDPFVAGLSGIFHVDALLGTFILLSLLLALPPTAHASRIPHHVSRFTLAGITTALAILSKSPGLILLAFVPAIIFWSSFRRAQSRFLETGGASSDAHSAETATAETTTAAEFASSDASALHLIGTYPSPNRVKLLSHALRGALPAITIWAAALVLSLLLLLPALWAAPGHVIATVSGLAGRLIETAVRPTFFMGEMVFEPGPTFYPIAVAFRLSPAVTLGLLASLFYLWHEASDERQPSSRHLVTLSPRHLVILLFALTFLVFLTLAEKKFDRYALPAIMALILLAGWGISRFTLHVSRITHHASRITPIALITLHALYLLAALPYPLMAANWLLGGTVVGAQVLPLDWGEGAGAGARWLADELPDAGERRLYAENVPSTAPFYPGLVAPSSEHQLAWIEPEDYLLVVDRSGLLSMNLLFRTLPALHVQPEGHEWVHLYAGLDAVDLDLHTPTLDSLTRRFDQAVSIVAAGIAPAAWPQSLPVVIQWQAQQPADFQLLLELVDDVGQRWAQLETPLLNGVDFPGRYWTPGETQNVSYELPFPPDLAPGRYQLRATLFDEHGARLGVFDADGEFIGVSATLSEVEVQPPRQQSELAIPIRLEGERELKGYASPPAVIGNGERLSLDLWWQAGQPESGQLALQIGDQRLMAPLDTSGWGTNQTYHIRPTWRLPANLPAGRYPLQLLWLGEQPWDEAVTLGEIEVEARDRNFELPTGTALLNIRLGDVTLLQDVAIEANSEHLLVRLVWQALAPDGAAYTAFVHLRDQTGQIVDQVDRPPSPPTDTWLPDQVIVDEYTLALSEAAHSLAIGLYLPESGARLPVYGPEEGRLADDQYVVELEDYVSETQRLSDP